ncbi:ABC transporter ATP-binding protein [Candidatus Aerophobetes bacterium Ae_b3b]|nr:MAG: ABC transporter ATP-binding protein [Candidatus Aerophobetes bacterium Ae_b3b]
MLMIRNLHKRFGGLHALENVSLVLESRKIWSLIGPNGAGKTTLFNLITGTLPADSGKIEFMGEDITDMKPYEICRKGIARTYQQKNLFPNLSVFDNVIAGMLKDSMEEQRRKERVYEILEFLGLEKKEKEIVSSLPPLDSKLVELGRALATTPKLILLDELVGGLVPTEIEKICQIVETLRDQGYTIFQIGHEIRPIMRTSDWIFVLDEGCKIAEGSPEEIRDNKDVHSVYLE